MQKSAGISATKLAAKVGRRMEVLVDTIDGKAAIARSMADAPEIDGVVRIVKGGKLKMGELVEVEITGSSDHDLEAKIARDATR
jgi:ribosomal protein S12 methylthiotransferase